MYRGYTIVVLFAALQVVDMWSFVASPRRYSDDDYKHSRVTANSARNLWSSGNSKMWQPMFNTPWPQSSRYSHGQGLRRSYNAPRTSMTSRYPAYGQAIRFSDTRQSRGYSAPRSSSYRTRQRPVARAPSYGAPASYPSNSRHTSNRVNRPTTFSGYNGRQAVKFSTLQRSSTRTRSYNQRPQSPSYNRRPQSPSYNRRPQSPSYSRRPQSPSSNRRPHSHSYNRRPQSPSYNKNSANSYPSGGSRVQAVRFSNTRQSGRQASNRQLAPRYPTNMVAPFSSMRAPCTDDDCREDMAERTRILSGNNGVGIQLPVEQIDDMPARRLSDDRRAKRFGNNFVSKIDDDFLTRRQPFVGGQGQVNSQGLTGSQQFNSFQRSDDGLGSDNRRHIPLEQYQRASRTAHLRSAAAAFQQSNLLLTGLIVIATLVWL